MAFDADEVLVAGTGHIYVAPEGTTLPTDVGTPLNGAFVDLGFATADGPRFSFDRTTKDLNAWQSFDPVRTLVTAVPKQVEFDLLQWNDETLALGLGGATVTATADGYKLEPAAASFFDVRALVIEGVDGDFTYRWVFSRAQNTKALTFPFRRDDASPLTIGMKVLAASGDDQAFYLLTDDPVFGTGS